MLFKGGFLCLVLAGLLAGGCAFHLSTGELPVGDPGVLVRPGQTREAELKTWLGEPDLVGLDEDGRPTWTWSRMTADVSPGRSRLTGYFRLTVSWEGGVVRTFSFERKASEP